MGAVVAAILVGGVLGMSLGLWGPQLKRPSWPGPTLVTPRDRARDLNQEAKNLVREGRWVEAKAMFEEVLEIMPAYGNGTVQQYLDRATKEAPIQGHLDAAQAALNDDQLGVAFHELEQCGDTQQQYERRDKLTALLGLKMESKVKSAQALLGSQGDHEKMVELAAMAQDLLAVKPDDREGLEFKKTAEDAIGRLPGRPRPHR
jgi:hypothetical protein